MQMRLARLDNPGGAPNSLIVVHEGCRVFLDCTALPALPAPPPGGQQQPQHAIQLAVPDHAAALVGGSQPDAILISSAWGLLGLAHLQQQLQAQGRDLPIHTYCTEPCLHFFQQMAQELLDANTPLAPQQQLQQQQHQQQVVPPAPELQQMAILHRQVLQVLQHTQQQQGCTQLHQQHAAPSAAAAAAFTPQAAAAAVSATKGQAGRLTVPLFSACQLQSVLDAVQVVRCGQRLRLPGCFGLTAEARPSGSGIGSCLWLLRCGNQRYAYLSTASLSPGPSAPLHQPSLHNLNVLLLAPDCLTAAQPSLGANDIPVATSIQQQAAWATGGKGAPPSQRQQQQQQGLCPADMLAVAANAAAPAVARGGCVLVPVVAGEGAVLQLLEALPAALAAAGPAATAVPLLYLSPTAADFLATASSCCEYLEQRRLHQVLEAGTPPFLHDQLMKAGQLLLLSPGRQQSASTPCPPPAAAAGATVGAAGPEAMQVDTGEPAAAPTAGGRTGISSNSGTTDSWGPLVQDVLSRGPCIVFVPLWSLAAGPGRQLSAAWCSSPLNLLLLPESGPLTATWLQQCCDAGLLPPQQQWQWQVQYAPIMCPAASLAERQHGSSSGESGAAGMQSQQGGLTAEELLGVLGSSSGSSSGQEAAANGRAPGGEQGVAQCQLVASDRDTRLIQAALQQQQQQQQQGLHLKLLPLPTKPPAASQPSSSPQRHPSSTTTSLLWRQLDLPAPLVEASISAELAANLQLQRLRVTQQQVAGGGGATAHAEASAMPLQVHEVSVARVQALLSHRSGNWRLEVLPTGPRPEAVSAVLAQQQQPQQQLLWGRVDTARLLKDVQAAGFKAELAPTGPATGHTRSTPGSTTAPASQQQEVVITVNVGAAQVRLSGHESEVVCDDASLRQQLLQCLMGQLHSVQ